MIDFIDGLAFRFTIEDNIIDPQIHPQDLQCRNPAPAVFGKGLFFCLRTFGIKKIYHRSGISTRLKY